MSHNLDTCPTTKSGLTHKTRNQFSIKFKQECVNLVVKLGYSVVQAVVLQVGLLSMQRWVGQYKQELRGVTPLARALQPEQQRIQAIELEVKQLKRDNDLLKKASACLSQSKCKRATSRRAQTEEG